MIMRWLSGRGGGGVVPPKRHGIKPGAVPEVVVQMARKLQQNDYQAFIVGGSVRDLLLGFSPRDFELATDALPEDVRRVFRRQSRIIGRRFRIVHVYFYNKEGRRDVLEVCTFRAAQDADEDDDAPVNNNIYGTSVEEDAKRRDFTINGLFYDPVGGDVIDYVGGLADIRRQKIRMIGEVSKRLPEDSVRALRAIRLANRLGLTMERRLEKSLAAVAPLLAGIPHPRLFEELLRALKSGASTRVLQAWRRYGVAAHVLPALEDDNPFFFSALAENDRRISESRPTSVTFIIAALFWPKIAAVWHRHRENGDSPVAAMEKAMETDMFLRNRVIPRARTARATELFFLQAMLEEPPTGRRAARLLRDPIFDRALAFSTARQDTGAAQTASWWSQYAKADERERERMLTQLPDGKKRRRRRKKPTTPAA